MNHNNAMPGSPESFQGKQGWQAFHKLTGGDAEYRPTVQANFPRSGYYTVQFAVTYPFVSSEFPPNFITLAEVVWSVEGNFIRRLISLYNGAVISGSGQAVKVTLLDYSSVPVGGPFQYGVSVQITPDSRPAEVAPPSYQANTDASIPEASRRGQPATTAIATLTSATFEVPQNAGANGFMIQCSGRQIPGVPFVEQQLQDGVGITVSNSLGTTVLILDGRSLDKWIPMPPDGATIQVSNASLLDIVVTPIYSIEG